jgi:methionine salvage enolase-phosphatase E1
MVSIPPQTLEQTMMIWSWWIYECMYWEANELQGQRWKSGYKSNDLPVC